MSSRELLELLDGLTEESWYKVAVRRDIQKYKDDQERERTERHRNRMMSGLYRKVPKHLQPREVVS